MGVFRFSNAVSDISKFITTYKNLYAHFIEDSNSDKFFGHEEAAKFLAENGLASSLGAVGKEALRRSTRPDKSRDPLYNQHKSYSEIFRMLGWYQPGDCRTNFKLTEYGAYIAQEHNDDVLKKLFGLNVLHIVSPNPLTSVRGENVLRPFAFLLKLMLLVDCKITTDELIIGVLACENDTEETALETTANKVKRMRATKKKDTLDKAILNLRERYELGSPATLRNYTRFPLSAMKWMGWATSKNEKGIYGQNETINVLSLTEKGRNLAHHITEIPDVRLEQLNSFKKDEKVAFVAYSILFQLAKIGFKVEDVYPGKITELKQACNRIIKRFNINDDFLFFGYQEAPREILRDVDLMLDG
jgi:hypothetical protein